MLCAIDAAARRRQATPFIPVVVESADRDRFADHEGVARDNDGVLERLPERPELLVVAVGVLGDRIDERIEHGQFLMISVLRHESRL